MEKRKRFYQKWWFWLVTALILVTIGVIYLININTESVTNEPYSMIGKEIKITNRMKEELYQKIKNDITDNLKTPSTAIFPEIKEWDIDVNSNNVVEVKSYVDSQNSFGAMLRANFEQQYILLDNNNCLCIYKEFDDIVQFDITERTENNKIFNIKLSKEQIEDFIKKAGENSFNVLYNKTLNYNFNEEKQKLEWNIKITSQTEGDLKSNCYLALTAVIDECICIPTVKTKINVYLDSQEEKTKVATVDYIDFNFLIKDWNSLCDIGINNEHLTTDFEKEVGERLIQEEIIKNMEVDYWNK